MRSKVAHKQCPRTSLKAVRMNLSAADRFIKQSFIKGQQFYDSIFVTFYVYYLFIVILIYLEFVTLKHYIHY